MKKYTPSYLMASMAILCSLTCIGLTGCSSSHERKMEVIRSSFTNQACQIKHTTYQNQFIVRCEDGSIWEVKMDDGMDLAIISYKNCIFDPLYKLPEKPVAPPLPPLILEKNQ